MLPFVARWILRFLLRCYRSTALYISSLRGATAYKSEAERRVVSGESWDEFCDTLKAAGAAIVAPGAPMDPLTQAEGYRYLSRLARGALEHYVECSNVVNPQLYNIADGNRPARVCVGSDNPDNRYETAIIDSRYRYLVEGYRGNVPYLGIGTQKGRYGGRGGLQTVDYIEADHMWYDDDNDENLRDGKGRRFSIILSADRPTGTKNWLRLSEEVPEAMLIVRQTHGRRNAEIPASIKISLLSHKNESDGVPPANASILTPQDFDKALQSASIFVAGASTMFAKWAYEFQSFHTNQLPLFDPKRSVNAGGDPNIRYYHSYWRLINEDEVLRIRFRPPQCRFWNFQLNNHWMESLDYRYHNIHTNNFLAQPDDDDPASYTIMISHRHPTCKKWNWIETVGHTCGTMCFRYVAPEVQNDSQLPHPRVDIVSYNSL